MATPPSEGSTSPWHAVTSPHSDRGSVAPSKPAMPAATPAPAQPEPIEVDEADVIAPVQAPPDEEIMPTASASPWNVVAPEPTTPPDDDPFRQLSDAAVRNSTMGASGAPTPLAGIPLAAAAKEGRTTVSPTASFTPEPSAASPGWVAGDPRDNAPAGLRDSMGSPVLATEGSASASPAAASPGTPATPPAAATPPKAPSRVPEFDDEPAYTPTFSPVNEPPATDTEGGDEGGATPPPTDGGDDDGDSKKTPWWRSAPFLVIVGLLVMGGIGYGIFTVLNPEEEPIELTPEVIVEPAPSATIDPIELEDPTAFQAAMPATVSAYAMTSLTVPEDDALDLTVRYAEAAVMEYSDGTDTLTLTAVQHYKAGAAKKQYEAITADGTNREPVEVGGKQVGERANVSGEDGDAIVWRNNTALFVLTGPADALEGFYAQFPL